jgi:hypothetical protein
VNADLARFFREWLASRSVAVLASLLAAVSLPSLAADPPKCKLVLIAEWPVRRGQECEARFYVAERFVADGRRDDARPLLETAREQCPRNFVEHEAAIAELANLQ